MKNQQIMENDKKGAVLTLIGIAVMILMTLTKVVPSSTIAGYSVFVGIVFFFITEAVNKTRGSKSGLRFNTIIEDIKKPGVILWMLLPGATIVTLVAGNMIFGGEFIAHVMGRASSILSFDKIALLIGQVIIAAFGEEIAYRGFFFGKSSKLFPVWVCAVVSSAVFAAGHITTGNTWIVAYDIASVFIDSLIFSVIYHKSGNCVISTFSHIFGNTISIIVMLVFF
ncbi:MAG: type II CAAX endopeptidase family protein [Oscillospiraceae bacterium]|nr:type II CAAX endopeptidase family protein [Oscillospiraceae bacterium]